MKKQRPFDARADVPALSPSLFGMSASFKNGVTVDSPNLQPINPFNTVRF